MRYGHCGRLARNAAPDGAVPTKSPDPDPTPAPQPEPETPETPVVPDPDDDTPQGRFNRGEITWAQLQLEVNQ
jgi:hypothetical protein